ncbi:MAG: cysteine desulfurase family protein [Polyangiaceae bacterium]|nr:cysteine desulfurase family protein [Polyangiaceae bacterium]
MTQRPEIYLDWNATSPLCEEVRAAQQSVLTEAWGNPSSVHASGRRARQRVDETREAVAGLLGVSPRDLLFTSGGTEANNLALWDAASLATSRLEHPSVVRVAEALAARGGKVMWLSVPPSGRLDPAAVGEQLVGLPPGTWVSVMAVNHETGVIQPVRAIADVVHASGFRLHVDAVQGVGKLPPSHWAGADRVSIASHKIRGPKGIGVLAWVPGSAPHPVLLGGAQERGLRPGTVDASLVVGFGVALQRGERLRPERGRLAELRDKIERCVVGFADANGSEAERLGHVANLSFHGWRGDELVAALDLEGFCVSSGSACSAGTTELSPVIESMLGRKRAGQAVRISLGELTQAEEIDAFIAALGRILRC